MTNLLGKLAKNLTPTELETCTNFLERGIEAELEAEADGGSSYDASVHKSVIGYILCLQADVEVDMMNDAIDRTNPAELRLLADTIDLRTKIYHICTN